MKKFLLPTLLLAAILFAGCDSFWEWPFGKNDEAVSDTTTSETWTGPADATSSLNRYTDLINDVHSQMQYLDDDATYFENGIASYNDYGYDPSFTCYYDLYDREALYNDTMNPNGLSSDQSADLISRATAIFAASDEAQRLCKELGKYVTAQDYKEDDFATGLDLAAQIHAQVDAYYDLHNAMLDTVDTLNDSYNTWTVDPNDPISVAIGNMNEDLDSAEDILNFVESAYTESVFDGKSAELQILYDTLSASISGHTANTPVLEDYINYYYEDFYSVADETFLPTVKRAIRTLDSADSSALSTDYNDLLDYYNLMVDDFNYYLDASGY